MAECLSIVARIINLRVPPSISPPFFGNNKLGQLPFDESRTGVADVRAQAGSGASLRSCWGSC